MSAPEAQAPAPLPPAPAIDELGDAVTPEREAAMERALRWTPGFLGARLRRELALFFSRLDTLPVVVFIAAGLTLWAYDYYGSIHFFHATVAPRLLPKSLRPYTEPFSYFYWYGSAFLMLMLVPQIIVRLTTWRLKSHDIPTLGWGLGDWKTGVRAIAIFYGVMLPILFVVVWTSDFQGKYPLYEDADRSWRMFASYEVAYALYFVAWEYFFRGFLTFSLRKSLGIWTIFVQMLPFVVMHFGKPDLEAMSSVFGGIALGWLALRTRSFWYGVFIHAATAVSLDCLVVLVKHLKLAHP